MLGWCYIINVKPISVVLDYLRLGLRASVWQVILGSIIRIKIVFCYSFSANIKCFCLTSTTIFLWTVLEIFKFKCLRKVAYHPNFHILL